MSWVPTKDRVLIELEALEEVRASGIVVPGDAEQGKVRYAVVRVVGPEVRELSAGDRIILSGYAGSSWLGSDSERLVKEADVMGVVS